MGNELEQTQAERNFLAATLAYAALRWMRGELHPFCPQGEYQRPCGDRDSISHNYAVCKACWREAAKRAARGNPALVEE